jgi:uncharacterized membrane protein
VAAIGGFAASHVAVSGTSLRGLLVGRIGEGAYLGVYSLVSAALLVWAVSAYNDATVVVLWSATGLRHLALVLLLLAVPLVVGGLTSRNPTAAGQEKATGAEAAVGFVAITRHPVMMGIGLWALAHLLARGTLDGVIFFGGLLALAWLGPSRIDAKRRARDPAAWAAFAARTSYVPFAAILAGRNRLSLSALGWVRLALSAAVYVAFVYLHPVVIGPRVWPG